MARSGYFRVYGDLQRRRSDTVADEVNKWPNKGWLVAVPSYAAEQSCSAGQRLMRQRQRSTSPADARLRNGCRMLHDELAPAKA